MKLIRKKLTRAVLGALVPATLLVGGGPALGQEQEAYDTVLEEVLVTARKLEENIQTVPVAVTALGTDVIETLAITELADISKIAAGLQFDSELGRGSNRPVIRGQANVLGDSGVSYFIDGVYISGSIDSYNLNDIERIEVVKGPQSALYGRNTYSGAINFITRSPGDTVGGQVRAIIAEDDHYDISANFNGPITDTLGGGVAVRYYERGGPFTNTWDGSDIGEQENQSISGVLDWTPTDSFQARFRAYWSERDDGQPPLVATSSEENNCFFDNGSFYQGRGRYFCGVIEPRPIATDWPFQAPDQVDRDEDVNLSLRIDYDFSDSMSLVSITGYNTNDNEFTIDADYTPTSFQATNFTPNGFPSGGFPTPPFTYSYVSGIADFTFSSEGSVDDWSQELRLEFDGDGWRGLVGAYYFDQDFDSRSNRRISDAQQAAADFNFLQEFIRMQGVCAANPICESISPTPGSSSNFDILRNQESGSIRNMALFGLYSFDFADRWSLTLEARWQDEEFKQTAIAQNLGEEPSNITSGSASFDAFLPRVTLDYQLTDNSMLYALIATGTKPGGLNGAAAIEAGLPSFDEEDVTSFEIGSKNYFLEGTMVANFAAFFNEVEGYQLTQPVEGAGQIVTAITNTGDADLMGFEAEIQWRPMDPLTLTFNYAYVDTEFTAGRDENQGVLNDVADNGLVDCSTGDEFPDEPGCTSLYGSIVGNQIPRAAEHQAFLDAEWRDNFGTGNWQWYLGGNYSYESSRYAQVHNLAETGDINLVNARLGFTNDNWDLQLFGRNLTGEDAAFQVLRFADGANSFQRNFVISARRDTWFGLQGIYRW